MTLKILRLEEERPRVFSHVHSFVPYLSEAAGLCPAMQWQTVATLAARAAGMRNDTIDAMKKICALGMRRVYNGARLSGRNGNHAEPLGESKEREHAWI
jgi:hypothetical protein